MSHWLLTIATTLIMAFTCLAFIILPVTNMHLTTVMGSNLKQKVHQILIDNKASINQIKAQLENLKASGVDIVEVIQTNNSDFVVFDVKFKLKGLFYNKFFTQGELENKIFQIRDFIDRDADYD